VKPKSASWFLRSIDEINMLEKLDLIYEMLCKQGAWVSQIDFTTDLMGSFCAFGECDE